MFFGIGHDRYSEVLLGIPGYSKVLLDIPRYCNVFLGISIPSESLSLARYSWVLLGSGVKMGVAPLGILIPGCFSYEIINEGTGMSWLSVLDKTQIF